MAVTVPHHPKCVAAGPAASWLWFAGICYSREKLTDGFIAKLIVPTLVPGLSSPYRVAARLVEVKLWDDAVGGYQVHDYLERNPSKAEIDELRAAEAERKKSWRDGRVRAVSQRDMPVASGVSPEDVPRARVRAPAYSPSPFAFPSEALSVEGESAREETAIDVLPPAWGHGRPGASAGRGSLVGDHRRCNDAAAAACERGFCVPSWVVANWLAQLGNGPEARAEVAATVEHGLAALGPGAIGDDPKKYWPNFWTMRHGTRMTDAPKGDVFRDVARELDALEAQRGRH